MPTFRLNYNGLSKSWDFHGTLTTQELASLDLDNFEKQFLQDCKFDSSAADHLLALEMIYRRLQEQEAEKNPPSLAISTCEASPIPP